MSTILIVPTQGKKHAPAIAVDVKGLNPNEAYKYAVKQEKERSGLGRFKSWVFI